MVQLYYLHYLSFIIFHKLKWRISVVFLDCKLEQKQNNASHYHIYVFHLLFLFKQQFNMKFTTVEALVRKLNKY